MTTVQQLLAGKGNDVWSISPDASVYDAIQLMADREVGALLVTEGEKIRGIISERDYTRKVILHGRSSKEVQVRDIMSGRVYFVRPDQTLEDCMALMTEHHIRHLPVLIDGHAVGVISMRDLVESLITEKDQLIEHLENYITGR